MLSEFYGAATRKLAMTSEEAEEIVADFTAWTVHCPTHADLLGAARLRRRHQISWWDAVELGRRLHWSEDLSHDQLYGSVMVQNPFL